jgi:tRNA A-37 threonylcarbamoyl transferase component Bud32
MAIEKYVGTLDPGNAFRDWLMQVLGERVGDRNCRVFVYKINPASHTVCRYEFPKQGFSVVAKFYGEPTGWMREYDPFQAMENEFNTLKQIEPIVDIPRPLAVHRDFHCALLTEHIRGRSFYKYMSDINKEGQLYDTLTAIAHAQRRLHDQTKSEYRKDWVFARYHRVLDHLMLDTKTRTEYNSLLGAWWYSPLLDREFGCRIHGDPNPLNYLFNHHRVYMLDFESSMEHANFMHDLGIVAAELKNHFAIYRGDARRAEPYIGHFLWQYSRNEPEFRAITRALPFFISLGLLRMARMKLGPDHRSFVFRESKACLESLAR